MNHKFLEYIENELPPDQSYGLMGIAVISKFDGKQIDQYVVKQGKDGKGYFIGPMAQKMNDQWFKASLLDSNFEDQQLNSMVRKHVDEYYSKKSTTSSAKSFDEEAPF